MILEKKLSEINQKSTLEVKTFVRQIFLQRHVGVGLGELAVFWDELFELLLATIFDEA